MFACFCCKAKVPNEDFSDDPLPNNKENISSQKLKQSKLATKSSQRVKQLQNQEVKKELGKEKQKYKQLTLDNFFKSTKGQPKSTGFLRSLKQK